jgi:mono/diheme cytochrome c family protein
MPFLLKSILALFFFVTAIGAAASMFSAMGRAEKKISRKTLTQVHKVFGWLFLVLLLPLLVLGMRYWTRLGNQASFRAVFHALLAWGLIGIVILKVAIVKFYKQFTRLAPVLGMVIVIFAFVVFVISAGFYWVANLSDDKSTPSVIETAEADVEGNAHNGVSLFNALCLSCHRVDSEENKIGPGLKNLLQREKLPYSGRSATIENVKQQLIRPILSMPSFARLTGQEMADLLAFLKTL